MRLQRLTEWPLFFAERATGSNGSIVSPLFICDNRYSNKFLFGDSESWAALSIIEADNGLNLTLSQALIELFLTLLKTPPARIDRTSIAVILEAFLSGSRVGSGCPRGHLVSRN